MERIWENNTWKKTKLNKKQKIFINIFYVAGDINSKSNNDKDLKEIINTNKEDKGEKEKINSNNNNSNSNSKSENNNDSVESSLKTPVKIDLSKQ